jgi:hypothetical protein
MGVAGLMFEPHPANFEKQFFGHLYWFQIFKDQWGSVPSIPVAVLGSLHIFVSSFFAIFFPILPQTRSVVNTI